jgi:beta-galactosidase
LWDFDHPNLYDLSSRITENGTLLHAKTDHFGIRKVEIKPDGLYLNGELVRVVGFNRVSDSNQYGNTEPDVLVHHDVDLMKSAGADFARLMHTPQAPNLLDYLDEKGMMIIEEIPVWGAGDPQVKKDNPLTEQWLSEMINRDYNHPCVIGWSPGNELRYHYTYVHSMIDYIRKNLDSSRLLTYTSNTAAWLRPDPVDFSDFAEMNSYGAFGKTADAVRKQWPNKPIFFSEWGFKQIGASPSARIPGFDKGIADTVQGRPYVIGFSIWTFNDYRSGMKGTPASGNREWGVVDVQRRPKAAYYQVRKAFSPVHSMTITNGTIRIEPRTSAEVPSYVLRGYHVKWESRDATGAVQKQGTMALPELKPGDPPWDTPVDVGDKITAQLVTPTGYIVDEASS